MPKKCSDEYKQNIEIAVLQEQMKETKEFIFEVKDNHLPSIYKRLNHIDKNLAYWGGGLAVIFIVGQLLLYLIK